jgi:hypothetical protein
MALKQPTPYSFAQKVRLSWLAVVSPASFDAIEQGDLKAMDARPNAEVRYRVDRVRSALLGSLALGASAAIVGATAGRCAGKLLGPWQTAVTTIAVLGAAILLWATIAVRGWEVQTFSNATLTERVNRWIFLGLYWIGTVLLVVAASWAA